MLTTENPDKSVKWRRKVFFWLTEMTVVNAYIIYQQTLTETKQKCTQIAFRRELIQSLVQPLLTTKVPNHLQIFYLPARVKKLFTIWKKERNEGTGLIISFIQT